MIKEKTDRNISYISIQGLFWFQIRGHLISFGSPQLPKNIHYTTAFNENSPFINFHVTKSVFPDSNLNPKIGIVKINKKEIEQFENTISSILINTLLKPFDLNTYKKSNRNIGFLSNDKYTKGKLAKIIERELIKEIRPITKRRGNRINITADINQSMEKFFQSRVLRKSFQRHIRSVKINILKPIESGMLITKKEIIHVVRVYNNWYQIKDISLKEIMTRLTNEEITNKIIGRTKRAIVLLKKAKTAEDVKEYKYAPQLFLGNTHENK